MLVALSIDLSIDGIPVGTGAALGEGQGHILTIAITFEILFLALSLTGELAERGLSTSGEISDDLSDAAPMTASLQRRPPPGAVRQPHPRRGHPGVLAGPDPIRQDRRGHSHRCLHHTKRAGRPKHGRSVSSTLGPSVTRAGPSQPAHDGRSTPSRYALPPASRPHPTTPTPVMSCSPTSTSHMRVASTIKGALPADSPKHRQPGRTPVPRQRIPTPRSGPKRPYSPNAPPSMRIRRPRPMSTAGRTR